MTSHRIITSTLTIPNVTEKDAGAYYCSVWANNRIVRSKTAHLFYSGMYIWVCVCASKYIINVRSKGKASIYCIYSALTLEC